MSISLINTTLKAAIPHQLPSNTVQIGIKLLMAMKIRKSEFLTE